MSRKLEGALRGLRAMAEYAAENAEEAKNLLKTYADEMAALYAQGNPDTRRIVAIASSLMPEKEKHARRLLKAFENVDAKGNKI